MKEITFELKNDTGLHARPAAVLAKTAGKFKGKITLKVGSKSTDAKSIMALMSLGLKKGDVFTLCTEEDEAAVAIEKLINSNFTYETI